jgi:uncharacterized protein (TIGR02996 family)
MGYSTDFEGQMIFDKPLTEVQARYIRQLSRTRRMKRDPEKTAKLEDPVRKAVGLPLGDESGYFVGTTEDFGQTRTDDIVNFNEPPKDQPGLWCQWTIGEDNMSLLWDGGEKFYSYVDWLNYLIRHFFNAWGVKLTGCITWQGEDEDDIGTIFCVDNRVVKLKETQPWMSSLIETQAKHPDFINLRHAASDHPNDAARRLILADWLDENGFEGDAALQRFIAKRLIAEVEGSSLKP